MSSGSDLSICVFGSHSRGSEDHVSDKDVLICGFSRGEADDLIRAWEEMGWSVAFYTWNRLNLMSKAGSLFLQHLKLEGDIIIDASSRLNKVLQEYKPRKHYEKDFNSSLALFRPAERSVKSPQAAACMGDVLYTFLRNAMILKLANKEIYLFDYSQLLEEFKCQSLLSEAEVGTLKKLRLLKAAYRSRNLKFLNEVETFKKSKCIVSKLFNFPSSEICAYSDIRCFNLPYATLRDLEVRLISQFGISFLENSNDQTLQKLWRMICDPRGYSWHAKGLTTEYTYSLNLFLQSHSRAISAQNLL